MQTSPTNYNTLRDIITGAICAAWMRLVSRGEVQDAQHDALRQSLLRLSTGL